ncbi:MAG: vitamin B12-dependent ribonucleotide reductase [Thermoguttaceae bacterium]
MERDILDSQVSGGSATMAARSHKNADPHSEPLVVKPTFCPVDCESPFDTVEWELRTAAIKGEGGEVVFQQRDCEIPAGWSQLATNVVVSKYFYGEIGTSERETSVRPLIHRVVRTIADWGVADGYFATPEDGERFYRELAWLCLHQHISFNSPVWFNVGLHHEYGVTGDMCNWYWNRPTGEIEQPENPYEFPQASACFIQSVGDNMEDIMELARSEAMLFKFGSGTGTDLSTLRSHREKLSGGGKPSGPLSFMRVYDQIAGVVRSGGKTRRAAKMQSLKVGHPDILEFIECKWKEEQKARALISKGYGPEEAYSSVLYQNANLSVRVTDDFMEAVEQDQPWTTHWVTSAKTDGPVHQAREMFQRMADAAWHCGDPGIQYDTTINRWHTCPNSGRINASNPCSEYMFLDDSACNLASVNLMKFRREDGKFDAERFLAACRLTFIAQEILVDHASYPTKRIALNSHRFRPIGLGYSNLGSLVMASGIPYDSDAARSLASAVTALLHGAACRTSAELAAAVGTFEGFEENRGEMLRVMEMHWEKVEQIKLCPEYLKSSARKVWDEVLAQGRRYGFRNSQATVLAPTGTISFMMDCDTTGIEPDIALVKYKQLAGGGMMKIVNQTVPLALKTLGYSAEEVESIIGYVNEHDTIEGAADLKPEHLPVFDCAFQAAHGTRYIPWKAHVLMMAAAQPFLSGAISKTVNMPKDCTVEDVAGAYLEGWKLGLKALAVYRDGSKEVQPLSTKNEEKSERTVPAPRRERLPDTRHSVTHKFSVNGHEGYITVGLYPDGRPGEMFVTMAKEGSTIGGLMDCFGTAVSMSLQYGVPLEVYVNKFSHARFEPMGYTKNPEIRVATSIVDYIFRWLGLTFLPEHRDALKALHPPEKKEAVRSESEDLDIELRPAAMKAGGLNLGHGSAAKSVSSGTNGSTAGKAGPGVHSNGSNGQSNGSSRRQGGVKTAIADRSEPLPAAELSTAISQQSEQFAAFQTDAPVCDNCGAITVRNGNCYLCHVCGSSMGCS